MFSFFREPYESPDVDKKQDLYYKHSWTYEGMECAGLALACIMDSLSLSIAGIKWSFPVLQIQCDKEDIPIRNLYDKNSLEYHNEWLCTRKPLELTECAIDPSEKKIHLREDHGMDKLKEFSKKILKNRYVVEVVNSLPYNAANRRFIHSVKENGLVEIVLPWTDRGLGLVVKTTGRTIRETQEIARILKKEYGKL